MKKVYVKDTKIPSNMHLAGADMWARKGLNPGGKEGKMIRVTPNTFEHYEQEAQSCPRLMEIHTIGGFMQIH